MSFRIYAEIDIFEFEPWAGAKATYKRLADENRLQDFQDLIEELYPEGVNETVLNDILWFDNNWIYETLGMKGEEE